jgi:hypothetical protein
MSAPVSVVDIESGHVIGTWESVHPSTGEIASVEIAGGTGSSYFVAASFLPAGWVSADRQRIAELFPTAHRVASVASDRQRIAEIGVGPGSGAWHTG